MSRWFLLIVALFLACVLWMGRYSLFPLTTGPEPLAYKLDRFTGEIIVIRMK